MGMTAVLGSLIPVKSVKTDEANVESFLSNFEIFFSF